MQDVNENIGEQFQTFNIIVVWNSNSLMICKLIYVHNNPNKLKNLILSYRENL
jgi:hypothetical protein